MHADGTCICLSCHEMLRSITSQKHTLPRGHLGQTHSFVFLGYFPSRGYSLISTLSMATWIQRRFIRFGGIAASLSSTISNVILVDYFTVSDGMTRLRETINQLFGKCSLMKGMGRWNLSPLVVYIIFWAMLHTILSGRLASMLSSSSSSSYIWHWPPSNKCINMYRLPGMLSIDLSSLKYIPSGFICDNMSPCIHSDIVLIFVCRN